MLHAYCWCTILEYSKLALLYLQRRGRDARCIILLATTAIFYAVNTPFLLYVIEQFSPCSAQAR
ncbi:hypothetical protein B0H12DRAFT_1088854 [Mycena haematopus]|nr:hypothetical protein B0H12DRAFT_1088854 [Mycena haematopus]